MIHNFILLCNGKNSPFCFKNGKLFIYVLHTSRYKWIMATNMICLKAYAFLCYTLYDKYSEMFCVITEIFFLRFVSTWHANAYVDIIFLIRNTLFISITFHSSIFLFECYFWQPKMNVSDVKVNIWSMLSSSKKEKYCFIRFY